MSTTPEVRKRIMDPWLAIQNCRYVTCIDLMISMMELKLAVLHRNHVSVDINHANTFTINLKFIATLILK